MARTPRSVPSLGPRRLTGGGGSGRADDVRQALHTGRLAATRAAAGQCTSRQAPFPADSPSGDCCSCPVCWYRTLGGCVTRSEMKMSYQNQAAGRPPSGC